MGADPGNALQLQCSFWGNRLFSTKYRTQFGSLIKLFGYESHIQEIYQYWQADLEFWYEAKKIQLEYSQNPEVIELEIKRLSDIRDKAVQARLQAEFASQVESSR